MFGITGRRARRAWRAWAGARRERPPSRARRCALVDLARPVAAALALKGSGARFEPRQQFGSKERGRRAHARSALWYGLIAVAAGLAVLLLSLPSAAQADRGALRALAGRAGCVESGESDCTPGRWDDETWNVALTHDGRNVYVLAGDSVAVFVRASSSGALSQLSGQAGCVAGQLAAGGPAAEGCAAVRAMRSASSMVISPDGRNGYVSSPLDNSLAVFRRDQRTGALSQLTGAAGCIRRVARDGCTVAPALDVESVAVSPDGRTVYALGLSNIVAFRRDPRRGVLHPVSGPRGCLGRRPRFGRARCTPVGGLEGVNSVAFSPDSHNLYATADGGTVAIFARNTTDGTLRKLPGHAWCIEAFSDVCEGAGDLFAHPTSIVISPDGHSAYVTADAEELFPPVIQAFHRDQRTGALHPVNGSAGCVGDPGDGCSRLRGLSDPGSAVVSPDGRNLYIGGFSELGVFNRHRDTSGLTQRPHVVSCQLPCFLDGFIKLAMSADGRNVYALGDALVVFART
jgi:hypothetical protein